MQDGEGRLCQLLSGGDKENLGEEEEHAHECLSLFVQRFEAVDSVILTPQVIEQPDKTFDSIRIFLQKRGA